MQYRLSQTIDIHSHVIPDEILDFATGRDAFGVSVTDDGEGGVPKVVHRAGYTYPLIPSFRSVAAKLEELERMRVDKAVVSIAPPFFYYDLDMGNARESTKRINDGIARMVAESGGKLLGMATLPLQQPEAAANELERAVKQLHLVGAEVGPTVGSTPLDSASFDRVFETAERLGVPLFIHPYYTGTKPGLGDYYLTNVVANPLDTAVCLIRMAYAGVFERFPGLKVLAAHGGGYAPYQAGRADHAHAVREECRNGIAPPSDYLRRVYYDTVVFSPDSLRFLLEWSVPGRVVLGSDAPFDMGDERPGDIVEKAGLEEETVRDVLAETAKELFSIDV